VLSSEIFTKTELNQLTFTWIKPVITAEMLAIDSYKVYWDAGYLLSGQYKLKAEINSYDHYFYEAEDLTPGVYYSFQVSSVNAVGESELSLVISHFAQSVPGKPEAVYRVSSTQETDTTASIELAWHPLIQTGGVPVTGFRLYSVDEAANIVLEFDGTDQPELLSYEVTGLRLDEDYSFYVTGLNPLEGEASDQVTYRTAGRPSAVGAITEIADTRTGQRLGLEWADSSTDGGSPILVYTLALV